MPEGSLLNHASNSDKGILSVPFTTLLPTYIMTHELDTRLNRRVSHVSYVPEHEDDDELLALEEELEAVTVEIWKPNW